MEELKDEDETKKKVRRGPQHIYTPEQENTEIGMPFTEGSTRVPSSLGIIVIILQDSSCGKVDHGARRMYRVPASLWLTRV